MQKARPIKLAFIFTALTFISALAPARAFTDESPFDSSEIKDASSSRHPVKVMGNTVLDTANPKFGSASLVLDGIGDYLSIPDHADFDFGTGDFTIDFWVRFSMISTTVFMGHSTAAGEFAFGLDGANRLWTYLGSSSYYHNFGTWSSPATGVWYHLALVRSGSDVRMFIDGVQFGSTYTNTQSLNSTAGVTIGAYNTPEQYLYGWFDEIRISKGIARWKGNFAPPNQSTPPDSGTKLLINGEATSLPPPDTTPPVTPQGLNAAGITDSSLVLNWTANQESDLSGYKLYRNGSLLNPYPLTLTTYQDTGLLAETAYAYELTSFDLLGNESPRSPPLSVTTAQAPDTQAPTTPTNLTAAVSSSQIDLSWIASSDDVGVTGYNIYRDGVLITSHQSPVTTYLDTGLTASTVYTYAVSAFDAAGNESAQSDSTSAATLALPNSPPSLEPIADIITQEGEVITIAPRAADLDGDVLTYSITGLPQGADYDFDPKTGVLNWRTNYQAAGEYDLTFTADDGRN